MINIGAKTDTPPTIPKQNSPILFFSLSDHFSLSSILFRSNSSYMKLFSFKSPYFTINKNIIPLNKFIITDSITQSVYFSTKLKTSSTATMARTRRTRMTTKSSTG